jgi:hypothetical protein
LFASHVKDSSYIIANKVSYYSSATSANNFDWKQTGRGGVKELEERRRIELMETDQQQHNFKPNQTPVSGNVRNIRHARIRLFNSRTPGQDPIRVFAKTYSDIQI